MYRILTHQNHSSINCPKFDTDIFPGSSALVRTWTRSAFWHQFGCRRNVQDFLPEDSKAAEKRRKIISKMHFVEVEAFKAFKSALLSRSGKINYLVLDFTPVTTADFSAIEVPCKQNLPPSFSETYLTALKRIKRSFALQKVLQLASLKSVVCSLGSSFHQCNLQALSDVLQNFREKGPERELTESC